MSAAEAYLEALVVQAWNWHRFMADGCDPTDPDDVTDLVWIQAFTLGRFGPEGLARIRSQVRPRTHISMPDRLPAPDKFTRRQLQALANGTVSLETVAAAQ